MGRVFLSLPSGFSNLWGRFCQQKTRHCVPCATLENFAKHLKNNNYKQQQTTSASGNATRSKPSDVSAANQNGDDVREADAKAADAEDFVKITPSPQASWVRN